MSELDRINKRELEHLIRLSQSQVAAAYRRPSDDSIERFFLGDSTPEIDAEIRRAMRLSRDFRLEMREIARDLAATQSKEASDTFKIVRPDAKAVTESVTQRLVERRETGSDRTTDLTVEEIAAALPSHLVIKDVIGKGGFATVYRVHNSRLGVDWAMKSIHLSKLAEGAQVNKVLKEARIPAKIHHPNVVTIHDVDEQNGLVFMECVDGPSLKDIINEGVASWIDFRSLASGILSGLAEAHRRGIVHGDLSPRNILLTNGRIPKLVDFGFSRHVDRTKTTIGITPGYASPEHIKGRELSPQSDVFSAGIILYRMATGRDPFPWDRSSHENYFRAVTDGALTPPNFRLWTPPPGLGILITRALAKDRNQRYVSAVDMLQSFENVVGPIPIDPIPDSHSRKARKHYDQGIEFYKGSTKREMDWAEEEFNKALIEDPKMALAHVGLADVSVFRYMSYFDRTPVALAKAEHYCQQALSLAPASPEALRALGRVMFSRRDYAAAEEKLREALKINPDYLEAHISLAWCYIEAHELDKAEQAAMAAKIISEDAFEVMMTFARIFYDKKEFERSASAAQEEVNIHRKSGRGYYDLGLALRALGKFTEAKENFAMSLEYHGDPTTRVDLGLTELFEGELQAAREQFLVAKDQTFGFLANYYLGLTEHLSGNRGLAESAFRQSLELCDRLSRKDPADPFPKAVGAMAAAALQDSTRAIALSAMARELDPKDGYIAYYCACARAWSEKPSAKTELDAAVSLPHAPSALEVKFDPHFRL